MDGAAAVVAGAGDEADAMVAPGVVLAADGSKFGDGVGEGVAGRRDTGQRAGRWRPGGSLYVLEQRRCAPTAWAAKTSAMAGRLAQTQSWSSHAHTSSRRERCKTGDGT